jgi:hypothetical protein
MCEIMEGNPRAPYIEKHESIMSIKADKCKAFTVEGNDSFFFMDENFIVSVLKRNDNNRQLAKC